MRETLRRYIDDWTILKYGWLAVFIIHIAFLAMGVFWLKQALRMEHPSLYNIPQLRISHTLTALYLITIAFSIILLIITVFVFEIFRTTRRLAREIEEVRDLVSEAGASSFPSPRSPPPGAGSSD